MQYKEIFERVQRAGRELNLLSSQRIDAVLSDLADAAEAKIGQIVEANALDLAKMDKSNPMYDRLLLSKDRIQGIASDIRNVVSLPSPLGLVLDDMIRPNGIRIEKISVPFGVIGVIYEARPNVSFDVFSLCLKSGNACLLKGGSDAHNSNRAIVEVIQEVLRAHKLNEDIVVLLPSGREATAELLEAAGYVDLIIPRGSKGLIDFVRDNARVPVIETGAGICHTYLDRSGDKDKCAKIVFNAKTRRISVCNALDCLVVHHDKLFDLPDVCMPLAAKNVKIFADKAAYNILDGRYPAELLLPCDESSFGTEFLSYTMSVKTVGSIDEALEHISQYSSKHSEAIVAEDSEALSKFVRCVDAACVYTNVSTAFTDGAEFGLGAEIGISTQKLHARGPMALRELTSYKYIVTGDGQIRE